MEEIVNRKIGNAITAAAAVLALCGGLFSMFARRTPAQTAELHVMVSDGLKTAVEELTPQIEQATGRKLVAQFDSSKHLKDKIQSGEPFDAAIITSDALDELIKEGKVASAGRTEISRTGIGMGVRAGATKPDIGTAEELRRTLMNAKAITFNPTGASAVHTNEMLARLGIAQVVKSKLMLDAEPGRPQMNVADGKAELVFSLIPEIKFFPGVDLVGPVPAEFQSYINFAGGIGSNAHDSTAAQALIKFLTGPAAAPVLKSKGMEPR
jgi:molybdate transport system substrate-binding protein